MGLWTVQCRAATHNYLSCFAYKVVKMLPESIVVYFQMKDFGFVKTQETQMLHMKQTKQAIFQIYLKLDLQFGSV